MAEHTLTNTHTQTQTHTRVHTETHTHTHPRTHNDTRKHTVSEVITADGMTALTSYCRGQIYSEGGIGAAEKRTHRIK